MNLVEDLKYFFTKEGRLSNDWMPYLINRYLSFHPKTRLLSERMASDLFYVDKNILEKVYFLNVPYSKGSFWYIFKQYIKKTKEKESTYHIIIVKLQKKYHWTKAETRINTPLLITILERDKELLLGLLKECCVDMRTFKRFGFNMKDVTPKVEKSKQTTSLNTWFKR